MTKNKLYYGDNLDVLRKHVKDESVDLCYIDPPFNSKRNYNQIYNNIGKEDAAQAQAFVDTWTWNMIANEGYDEIISNKNGVFTAQSISLIAGLSQVLGKGSLLAYLVSMTQRIAEIYRVLKPTGAFYLHCDPTASHYLKLVLDAIFCSQGGDFRNEIIWAYSGGGRPNEDFARKHDVILRYSKTDKVVFNADEIRVPYNLDIEKYKSPKAWGSHKGSDKSYAPNELGKIPEDWWLISPINSQSKERLGYPTQKPESLLERIIKASSNEGDVILDAYCGCGTTIAVAERLKRNWIGIDITYQSVSLIMKRLEESFGKSVLEKDVFTLSGIPQDFDSAVALANKQDDRVRKEFEKWFVLTYSNNRAIINDKKGGDGGIDGTAFMLDFDEQNKQELKKVLFSVKSSKKLSPSVIRDLAGVLDRENAAIGYLLTLYPMPNLAKEAAKYGTYQNKLVGHTYSKIEVVEVQQILDGKTMYLPTTIQVVKKAERKTQDNVTNDIFES